MSMSVADPGVQAILLGDAADFAPAAILVADDTGRYVAVNRAACELLGYTREELLALKVTDIALYPEAAGEFADVVAHGQRSGVSRIQRKDGTEIDFRYRAGETKIAGMVFYVAVGWAE
jgi:PAS domain S-box-containing protein